MPAITRDSAFSRAASLKLRKLRVGFAESADSDANVKGMSSRPNAYASTTALVAPRTLWVDGKSCTGGVVRNGSHAGAGIVARFPSSAASRIAEIGRQKS